MPIHLAAQDDKMLDVVDLLIRKGVSPNAKTATNRTPLHFAAGAGSAVNARILLSKGAIVSSRDSNGDSPIHLAATNPTAGPVLDVLLEKY